MEANIVKMQKSMADNQKHLMERQRLIMMSTQMAMARERTWWFGGAASVVGLGILIGAMKGKNVVMAALPFAGLSTMTAFTADMGYGNKINRINEMHRDILNDERYFFNDGRFDLKN